MKLNQRIFWISVIISILTLGISIYLYYFIETTQDTEFIAGILLNIFAGTIVLAITSLFDYFIQRRDVLEDIMRDCLNFAKSFDEISYFDGRDFISYEKYKEYYKKNGLDDNEIKNNYDIDREKYLKNKKKILKKS